MTKAPTTAQAPFTTSPKTTKKPFLKLTTREKIAYAVFVVAWAALSIVASQYIIFFPLNWILGEKASEPFWTLVYYILCNTLAIAFIIFGPPKLASLYRHNHSADGKLRTAKKTQKATLIAKSTQPTSMAQPTKVEKTADQLFSTNPEELGIATWPTFVDIGLAPIAYVAYAMLANIAMEIFSHFSWFDANQEQNVGFNGYFVTNMNRVFAMLAIVFVAPIAEELIMRGWLYGKLRNKFKIPLAIFLTSALFGILHGQLNVGITVFILSSILCGLREITGTIWSGMLLHILANGIAFYQIFIML